MKKFSFVTDNNLCIRSVDGYAPSQTVVEPSTIIGKKYYEIFPRIVVHEHDALTEVIRTKKTVTCKSYPIACLSGGIKADITVSPLESRGNKVETVKIVIQPYSACPLEKKLHQSQELIDIGKIAATLAHGVRNPLNAIKGAVVYLREKYRTEEPLTEFMTIMEEEISRLELFITNFLSSSVSQTDIVPTDINALLNKIELFTSLQMYTRNIQSRFEFGTVPPVSINAFHMEQGILNVINNAIEAMQDGGELNIRTFTTARFSDYFVVISISDSGPGMDNRRDDALDSKASRNGRGFGLSITAEILRHYGGHLEIESNKTKGTAVSLLIPCQGPSQDTHEQ